MTQQEGVNAIHTYHGRDFLILRDWSLITRRGGLQNGKIAGPKLFAPPPQDRVKLFAPPLLKSANFTRPPYNMAKTSSFRGKSTMIWETITTIKPIFNQNANPFALRFCIGYGPNASY